MVGLGVERIRLRTSDVQIPLKALGHRLGFGQEGHALGPGRAIGPHVHFLHGADDAGLNPFLQPPHTLEGMAQIIHLRAHARLPRQSEQFACLPDGLGHRLFHVHVLAHEHGHVGGQEVHVIRSRDGDGVDFLIALQQHLSEVGIAGNIRKALHDFYRSPAFPLRAPVHIAKGRRGDFFRLHETLELLLASTAQSHEGDADFCAIGHLAGRSFCLAGRQRSQRASRQHGCSARGQKPSPAQAGLLGGSWKIHQLTISGLFQLP